MVLHILLLTVCVGTLCRARYEDMVFSPAELAKEARNEFLTY